MYRKSPSTLSIEPPDASYSGYLVLTDEEADLQDTLCWRSCGVCKRKSVKKLPFPQDKILSVIYTSEYNEAPTTKVWFLPVPGKPLASNCYFIIRAKGRHKGYIWIFFLAVFLSLVSFPYKVNVLTCYIYLTGKHAQAQEREIS